MLASLQDAEKEAEGWSDDKQRREAEESELEGALSLLEQHVVLLSSKVSVVSALALGMLIHNRPLEFVVLVIVISKTYSLLHNLLSFVTTVGNRGGEQAKPQEARRRELLGLLQRLQDEDWAKEVRQAGRRDRQAGMDGSCVGAVVQSSVFQRHSFR